MTMPYENATSGERAITDMQKILRRFGCDRFGQMMDYGAGELVVTFQYRGADILVKASVNGYAAAWLKDHPFTNRTRGGQAKHERRAAEIGGVAVYSILRDWIKGQIAAVETGVLSFEGAFLAQHVLPSGRTILEHATESKLLKLSGPKP